jgi:hypothetical protein
MQQQGITVVTDTSIWEPNNYGVPGYCPGFDQVSYLTNLAFNLWSEEDQASIVIPLGTFA